MFNAIPDYLERPVSIAPCSLQNGPQAPLNVVVALQVITPPVPSGPQEPSVLAGSDPEVPSSVASITTWQVRMRIRTDPQSLR